jgi:hypothetical protein
MPIALDASEEEQANQKDNLEHLSSDVNVLKEDLDSYKIQKKELDLALIKNEQKSEEAKLWLFNSDEIFVPILKGLSGINAMGIQLHTGDQMSETEILIK